MKIAGVESLALPSIKTVRFGRFADVRGYFTESFRAADVEQLPELAFLRGHALGQANESFSRPGTMRGLHFQWSPYVGKLIRTVRGRMVDLILDIRIGSPTFGQALMHDMPAAPEMPCGEWIWVPPGFAHGNFFTEDTIVEYLCTGFYHPPTEAGISPLAPDIDWSLTAPSLRQLFDDFIGGELLMSPKDRIGASVADWRKDPQSSMFVYGEL